MTNNELFQNWTLDKKVFCKSIFTKRKMVEMVDFEKVNGFCENEFGITYQGIDKYKGIATKHATELDQLKLYRNNYSRTRQQFNTAHDLPKHKWGRVTPSNYCSLAVFRRNTRHTLADGYYRDSDMVNCLPVVLSQICAKNNVACPFLDKYVKNPLKLRQRIMEHHDCEKDTAKKLIISLMHGGGFAGWVKDKDISKNHDVSIGRVIGIAKEMKIVRDLIYNANPGMRADIKRHYKGPARSKEDESRGIMALYCQTVERHFQEIAIQAIADNQFYKIEEIVPCQDGFLKFDLFIKEVMANLSNLEARGSSQRHLGFFKIGSG